MAVIRADSSEARIIMLSTFEGDVEIQRALEAGAQIMIEPNGTLDTEGATRPARKRIARYRNQAHPIPDVESISCAGSIGRGAKSPDKQPPCPFDLLLVDCVRHPRVAPQKHSRAQSR